MITGIIGAMETEVKSLCSALENKEEIKIGNYSFFKGLLCGKEVVIVKCGVGKVNAALCTQSLIQNFKVSKVINTGIAGAMGSGLKIFDFVVSTKTVYHDFDTTAFGYKAGQVPGMDLYFEADKGMVENAVKAFAQTDFAKEHVIKTGLIASGDQFICRNDQKNKIKEMFAPLCVEMEGCAIAHACSVNKVPFAIVRCMSDMADDTVEATYSFNEDSAAQACADFIKAFIKNL